MVRKIAGLFLVALLLAVCAPPAWAGDSLVNTETEVDATGKDAADARTQAMAKGEADALSDLLSKLTTAEQVQAIMNSLDPTSISGMVRSTEVLDEKIAGNHYHARLMITFDGDAITGLIGKIAVAGTNAADDNAVGSFLIIPAYEEHDNTVLWEDNNPWRTVWKTVGLEVNSGDLVVPYGDANDAGVVDAKSVASANYASLAPLALRYGASDIIILQAKLTYSPDMVLNVVERHINRTDNEVNMLTYRADPQETKDMLLLRAARDIAGSIQAKKIQEIHTVKTVQGGERNSVMVLASITTMASWTQIRSKLSALPMVDQLELLAISPQQVDIVVHYRGSPDSLATGITSQGLRLVKNPAYWVVSND